MSSIRRLAPFVVAILSVAAVTAAQIGEVSASTVKRVDIVGSVDLGTPAGQPFDFKQGRIVVKQGETVTWRNLTSEPHSITVVNPSEEPRTLADVNNCAVCEQYLGLHAPSIGPDGPQPPFVAVLDDFRVSAAQPARLDSTGDSLLVAPNGSVMPTTLGGSVGDSVSAVITAEKGTTLTYLCGVHPWMQGRIVVQ